MGLNKFCTVCGTRFKEDARFCTNCGSNRGSAGTSAKDNNQEPVSGPSHDGDAPTQAKGSPQAQSNFAGALALGAMAVILLLVFLGLVQQNGQTSASPSPTQSSPRPSATATRTPTPTPTPSLKSILEVMPDGFEYINQNWAYRTTINCQPIGGYGSCINVELVTNQFCEKVRFEYTLKAGAQTQDEFHFTDMIVGDTRSYVYEKLSWFESWESFELGNVSCYLLSP